MEYKVDVSCLNTSVLRFDLQLDDPAFGSDAVILDPEDGVHAQSREKAREVPGKMNPGQRPGKRIECGVRVNALNSIDGIRDVDVTWTSYIACVHMVIQN